MNIRDLEKSIKEGKNVDYELSLYMNLCASQNYIHSGMELAIGYYDLYEGILEDHLRYAEGAKDIVCNINNVIKSAVLSAFDASLMETYIKDIDNLRNRIIERMNVLTAYTDRFSIYEYILNRLEPKFLENTVYNTDITSLLADINGYIFNTKDNVVVNSRIKEIIGQIPVRLTKEKFYEYLKETMSIYEGAQIQTVNDYIYMLKSSAGLYKPEREDEMFLELKEKFNVLKGYDYKNIDKEGFKKLKETLDSASDEVAKATDCYYSIIGVINSLYAFLLNVPYADAASVKFIENIMPIIDCVNKKFVADDNSKVPEEISALFSVMEGELEKSADNIERQQAMLDIITSSYKEKLKSMMLEHIYECLMATSRLLSNSCFAKLFEKEEENKKADKVYIDKRLSELIDEFTQTFIGITQVQKRAVMAAVLKELPVFFTSKNEVMEYIKNSFSICHDEAEKTAAADLIKGLISGY